MKTKRKAIDLVAYKDGQRIAFEIETGKNSPEQLIDNIIKCLDDVDKLYIIATNKNAYEKINMLLKRVSWLYDSDISSPRSHC